MGKDTEHHPELQLVSYESDTGTVEFSVAHDSDTLWGTRQQIAEAFGCDESTVRRHILNVYKEKELDKNRTSALSAGVQIEGDRRVTRDVERYNLDVMISVGYRVNSQKATKFRQWASSVLSQFLRTGYAVDVGRVASDPVAQSDLVKLIRGIRLDERAWYKRVRDIFKASSSDYDSHSREATKFFSMAQDKFHYAITGKTAAEIVLERADASKPNMGLTVTSDKRFPTLEDARIAKNYLSAEELEGLENISEQFMLFAQSKAFRGQKMTMEELATKLNILLGANDYRVLYEYKSYLRGQADAHAKKVLDTYRKTIAPRDTPALPDPKVTTHQKRK